MMPNERNSLPRRTTFCVPAASHGAGHARFFTPLSDHFNRFFATPPKLAFEGYGARATGCRSFVNGDCFRIQNDLNLYVATDGFGVADSAAELAESSSHRFVTRFAELCCEQDGNEAEMIPAASQRLGEAFTEAAESANAFRRSRGDETSCGASLTALWCDRDHAHFASVGHCRGYRIRGGRIQQLTSDDTIAAEWDRAEGRSKTRSPRYEKILTKHLGDSETVSPQATSIRVQAEDLLLILTDGIYRSLNMIGIADLAYRTDVSELPQRLVCIARGLGSLDDCAAVVVRVRAVKVDSAIVETATKRQSEMALA